MSTLTKEQQDKIIKEIGSLIPPEMNCVIIIGNKEKGWDVLRYNLCPEHLRDLFLHFSSRYNQ